MQDRIHHIHDLLLSGLRIGVSHHSTHQPGGMLPESLLWVLFRCSNRNHATRRHIFGSTDYTAMAHRHTVVVLPLFGVDIVCASCDGRCCLVCLNNIQPKLRYPASATTSRPVTPGALLLVATLLSRVSPPHHLLHATKLEHRTARHRHSTWHHTERRHRVCAVGRHAAQHVRLLDESRGRTRRRRSVGRSCSLVAGTPADAGR